MSGVYITLLATMLNMSINFHKLYIFTVVEYYGIFWPQAILAAIAISSATLFYKRIMTMDGIPKESWAVSDSILLKVKLN